MDIVSPVAKITTIRLVLVVAAMREWFVHQKDINLSYGDLNEEVYMLPPPGYQWFCMQT